MLPIPAEREANGAIEEEHFFLWEGDQKQLERLLLPHQAYGHVDHRRIHRPVMTVWIHRHGFVTSTY